MDDWVSVGVAVVEFKRRIGVEMAEQMCAAGDEVDVGLTIEERRGCIARKR